MAYDLAHPPAEADIANFTNDRGDTVKSILLVEKGTINRGLYQIITFLDPSKPNAPWAPQKGWNGKLVWLFGASASHSRFQTPPARGLFEASGGRALAEGTYLQRAWRDAHAGRVHAANDPERALQMYGAHEFGHKVDPGMY